MRWPRRPARASNAWCPPEAIRGGKGTTAGALFDRLHSVVEVRRPWRVRRRHGLLHRPDERATVHPHHGLAALLEIGDELRLGIGDLVGRARGGFPQHV